MMGFAGKMIGFTEKNDEIDRKNEYFAVRNDAKCFADAKNWSAEVVSASVRMRNNPK